MYPRPFQDLIHLFASLPGIGPKHAERLTLYLMKSGVQKLGDFEGAFTETKNLTECTRCNHIAEGALCSICSDSERDHTRVCVVEEPLDIIALEKSGVYRGVYHSLGGMYEAGKREGEHLRIPGLLRRIETEDLTEIILGLDPTTEGDLTSSYLHDVLIDSGVRVTKLARGLATGADIEYVDPASLKAAFENRR